VHPGFAFQHTLYFVWGDPWTCFDRVRGDIWIDDRYSTADLMACAEELRRELAHPSRELRETFSHLEGQDEATLRAFAGAIADDLEQKALDETGLTGELGAALAGAGLRPLPGFAPLGHDRSSDDFRLRAVATWQGDAGETVVVVPFGRRTSAVEALDRVRVPLARMLGPATATRAVQVVHLSWRAPERIVAGEGPRDESHALRIDGHHVVELHGRRAESWVAPAAADTPWAKAIGRALAAWVTR
jgi:hypothetical protein